MKAPLAYLLLAAACGIAAYRLGGVGWLLLWPAAAFAYVAALYPLDLPAGWGKRTNGSVHLLSLVLLAPVRLTLLALWHGTRRRGPPWHRVGPHLYLGRRPFAAEVPPDVGVIVDLTSEFPVARGVRDGRRVLALPTLDYRPPELAAAWSVLDAIDAHADPNRPGVLIHCAAGVGRSATLAAAVLLRRGLATDADAAVKLLQRTRPAVRLNPAQRRQVTGLAGR